MGDEMGNAVPAVAGAGLHAAVRRLGTVTNQTVAQDVATSDADGNAAVRSVTVRPEVARLWAQRLRRPSRARAQAQSVRRLTRAVPESS